MNSKSNYYEIYLYHNAESHPLLSKFVTGIKVFYKPNKSIYDLYDEIPSKTLSFAEVEPRFFKKGRFQKVITHFLVNEFDQDAFVKDYFKKHFKTFAP